MIEALLSSLLVHYLAEGITAGALTSVYPAVVDLYRRHTAGWTTTNFQIEHVICRSFYAAMTAVCGECIHDLKTKLLAAKQNKKEAISKEEKHSIKAEIETIEDEIDTLEKMQRDFDRQIKRECKKTIPTVPEAQKAIPLLFTPKGTLSEENRLQLKHDLNLMVKNILERRAEGENKPISCCPRVRDTLYERMCACFAFELRHNKAARNVFQREILGDINTRIRGQEITSGQIAETLGHVADTLPIMLKRLDQIETAINEGMDTRFESILKVFMAALAANKTSFEETELQLRLLALEEHSKQTTRSLRGGDANAFFLVEKDEWKPLWLNQERPAVLGRKTDDYTPDIWFTNPYISRTHATVAYHPGRGYSLVDTSHNGTTVNGIRVAAHNPITLKHGDRVGLANDDVVLFFCTGTDVWKTFIR